MAEGRKRENLKRSVLAQVARRYPGGPARDDGQGWGGMAMALWWPTLPAPSTVMGVDLRSRVQPPPLP